MDGVPYVRVCAQGEGECVPGVFDWFGKPWGLSGVKASAVGLDVMGSPTKKEK